MAANVGLTALILFQSIDLKHYKLPLFAISLSYLTMLFYAVLPGSSRFIVEDVVYKNAELLMLSSIFIVSTFALFKLITSSKRFFVPLDEIDEIENHVKAGDRNIINISVTGNALIYSIFFGSLYAGTDLNSWGGALLILSICYLGIGFLYYDKQTRHSHALSWFVLFGMLSMVAVSILTRGVGTLIGWEIIILVLLLIRRLPYMKKLETLTVLGSQVIFGYFLISEPIGRYIDPGKYVSWANVFVVSPLFYIISNLIKRDKDKRDSPLFSTLEAILILVISISLIVTTSWLISVLWAVIGFCFIVVAIPSEDHSVSLGGLAVLIFALLKILLVDAAGLSSSSFILPIVIISPILIATGMIYQRMRDTSFKPNVVVERAHLLSLEVAKERVNHLTDQLSSKYSNFFSDPVKEWQGNTLVFSLTSFGFHIAGQIEIFAERAVLRVQLPMLAMVFKDTIVNSVDTEVGHLLEP